MFWKFLGSNRRQRYSILTMISKASLGPYPEILSALIEVAEEKKLGANEIAVRALQLAEQIDVLYILKRGKHLKINCASLFRKDCSIAPPFSVLRC